MDKKDWYKKAFIYTQAILHDIKSDFSPVNTLKVKGYPEGVKREAVRSSISRNPENIAKLLKKGDPSVNIELDILNQLTDIKRQLSNQNNPRQKFMELEESKKRSKHLDDLIELLKKEPDDDDVEMVEVINNYYGSSKNGMPGFNVDKPGKVGKHGGKRAGGVVTRKGGKTFKSGRGVGKGSGALAAVYAASDYVLGDRELNAENLSEDTGMITGAWAGAEAGAALGTLAFPGVGTAIGGAIGGILGGIAGTHVGKEIYNYFNEDKKEGLFNTVKILNEVKKQGVFDNTPVDSHGNPIGATYKKPSSGDVWADWDRRVEGTGRVPDKKIFKDSRGVLTMAGGVNIEAHPEYKDLILSGKMTGEEAMRDIGRKEFKTLLKKRPEIADMGYDAQQFAMALAKNVGGSGAAKFMPSIEAFNRGDFDTVRENMKSWKLTDNHKRNFERIMSELEARKQKKIPEVANNEDKKEDDRSMKELTGQLKSLDSSIKKLGDVVGKGGKSASEVKNVSKEVSTTGFKELPSHIEPITDTSLILLAGAE